MKLIIKDNADPFCYVYYSFINGSLSEKKSFRGLTHFIEHLHFRNSTDQTLTDNIKTLELNGISYNAMTTPNNTIFHIQTIPEHFNMALESLKKIVFDFSFSEDDFNKEKEVILREFYDVQNDKSAVLMETFVREIFGEEISPRGVEEDIKLCSYNDIKTLYNDTFGMDNLLCHVYCPKDFKETLNEAMFFPDISTLRMIPKNLTFKRPFIQRKFIVEENKEDNGYIRYISGFAYPFYLHRDKEKRDRIRDIISFTSAFLSDGMYSPLFKIIRNENSLCYQIDTSVDYLSDNLIFYIVSTVSSDSLAFFESKLRSILDTFYLDEERFNDTKKIIYSYIRISSFKPSRLFFKDLMEELYDYSGITEEFLDNLTFNDYKDFIKESGLFNYDNFSKYILG